MSRAATAVEVQPIDRLEEKVRQLVGVIDALRSERSKAADEIVRLTRELESVKSRLSESATVMAEVASLREERDAIRDRVAQMITEIDKLAL